jgi:hypothetical protein
MASHKKDNTGYGDATSRIEKALAVDLDGYVENAELDRRLNRKFDLKILPWLFGIWLFSFIDRSNIGKCALYKKQPDIDFIRLQATPASPA